MKRFRLVVAGLILVIAAAYVLFIQRRDHVNALYLNGKVYTVNDQSPLAEAFAVTGDRFVEVGSTARLRSRYNADTIVDLQGKPVYPGFLDAHAHVEGIGAALMTLNLNGKSLVEIRDAVRGAAAGKRGDQWVRGRGWDQNRWPTKMFPTHRDLDAVSTDRPVYLVRVDGHAAWVNKKVLEMARITRSTPDPPGGRIVRDSNGNPTGVFVDNAMELLGSMLPGPSEADREEAIRRAVEECLRKGITEVHDMGAGLAVINTYKKLASGGRFPFRVYVAVEGTDSAAVDTNLRSGPEVDLYDGRITVRAIKLYADGALGSRGAALVEPYSDDPGNRGLTLTGSEELRLAAERSIEKGFQLCVHAIGDRANSIVISAFEDAFIAKKVKGLAVRFRVEHAQVLDIRDIPKFSADGIIPSMQPVHCTSDMPWAPDRLGSSRIKGAYAWKSLINAGSLIPAGSDAPVEDPSPLAGFYAAITRQRPDGTPTEGWNARERMTRDEALKSFTIWGSYAGFQEKKKGSIEAGKWADFVVLQDDIMTVEVRKIPEVAVEMTVVGGKVAYARRPEK
jgi:hypothetical protein